MAAKSNVGSYSLQNNTRLSERRATWVDFSTQESRSIGLTNIAEGSRKAAPKDYARFLNITEGSLGETEYLVLLSRDLNYLLSDSATSLLAEIKELASMLHSLRKTVQKDAP